jgi:glutathione synthase/RimK-type ligase-like ATP-grasp enzyme
MLSRDPQASSPMPHTAFDVILLTADAHLAEPTEGDWYNRQIHREEALLIDGLRTHGLRAARRSWSDPAFDWSSTRAAVLRSTWDYFHRFAEFQAWLQHVRGATRLINDAALIDWNLDKHYLADLARRGCAVVPTHYVERGGDDTLASVMRGYGWDEIVFKPVVSGAARLTYRADAVSRAGLEAVFARCVAEEAMLVQPFQRDVLESGELSLVVIGGRCTHAVRKRARPGDFRVQDDHGGTVHPHPATPEEIAFAESAVACCPSPPAYARVDAVRDAAGELRVMELELIEPELFFRFHEPAARALADEIARILA